MKFDWSMKPRPALSLRSLRLPMRLRSGVVEERRDLLVDSNLVVVGTDGSAQAEIAVRWAADFASRRGADLLIATAVQEPIGHKMGRRLSRRFVPDCEHDGRETLRRAAALAAETASGVRVDTVLLHGRAGPALIEVAAQASALIVGARGRGAVASAVLGSVSSHVARHLDRLVVVVRDLPQRRPDATAQPVIVGVDGTTNSAPAVAAAAHEAALRQTHLLAVHAWRDGPPSAHPRPDTGNLTYEIALSEAILKERLAEPHRLYPELEISPVVAMDHPDAALWEWSAGAQLVVLGSR